MPNDTDSATPQVPADAAIPAALTPEYQGPAASAEVAPEPAAEDETPPYVPEEPLLPVSPPPPGPPEPPLPGGHALVSVPAVGTVLAHHDKSVRLRDDAAAALGAMIAAARADGIEAPYLLPTSGYRTTAEQQIIWDRNRPRYPSEAAERRNVAYPGHSIHQTGRAVDLWLGQGTGTPSENPALRSTAAWKWLSLNASRFGWYPYDKPWPGEAWHWEFGQPHDPTGSGVVAEVAAGQKAGFLA